MAREWAVEAGRHAPIEAMELQYVSSVPLDMQLRSLVALVIGSDPKLHT
jgi:hypothetical protein